MSVVVEAAVEQDIPALVELNCAQEARWHQLDARLRPARAPDEVEAMLAQQWERPAAAPLVARDAGGRVRGYALPVLREFSYESVADAQALEVFEPRTGFVESLTLPAPDEADTFLVPTYLLEAVQRWWQEQGAQAEMCHWPTRDTWPDERLRAAGLEPFLQRSVRAAAPLPPSRRPNPDGVRVRLAVPADEKTLVALYLEESIYHHEHSPFFRRSPLQETAFRAWIAPAWAGMVVEEGGPLIVVVERAGEVVALAVNEFFEIKDGSHRDYLPLGRYIDIAEVGVRADLRGQGIGRLLVQGVFDACARWQPDRYVLGFSTHNPLSSQFWPHLGFQPSLTFYQRKLAARV
jgi:GNAT superfamily N-acetyltransferase